MAMLTISENREYISSFYILYLDFMGAIQILILYNFTIFSTCDESVKKIGVMVPEIFNVFTLHAVHLPPVERKLSCAATFSTFPVMPHNFFYRIRVRQS